MNVGRETWDRHRLNDVEQLMLGQARDAFSFVGRARGEVMNTWWWIGLVGGCCRAHFSMCLFDLGLVQLVISQCVCYMS